MIRSFRHRGLERYFKADDPRGIPPEFVPRLKWILDRLDASDRPEGMNVRGLRFHRLKGHRKGTYAVDVSRNWRVTFRYVGKYAVGIDLEDYH